MLSNLETEKEKLLQIILIGQPELKTMLTLPALQQLNERITVRYDLIPLSADEVIAYIEHRLGVAGGPGKIKFTKGAYRAVYDFSEGDSAPDQRALRPGVLDCLCQKYQQD